MESAENANCDATASMEGLLLSWLKCLCTFKSKDIILLSSAKPSLQYDAHPADADMKEAQDLLHASDKEEASTSKVEDVNGEAAYT